jgi:BirA family biotin operon repressor/biotin-[acetyl-CoA-carboxylase] ligase
LTFTLAIEPAAHGLAVERESALALTAAVATIAALDELGLGGPSVGIRWPNDLVAGGRKFGGILPERIEVERGHAMSIGIGLNVYSNLEEFPPDVRAIATSVAALTAVSLSEDVIPTLLAAILGCFGSALVELAGQADRLAATWNRLDRLKDQWVSVNLGSRIVAGWARGIDAQGALCVDDGRELTHLFGGRVLRTA